MQKLKVKELGKALAKHRKDRGFSSSSVCSALGIRRQKLYEYESGKSCMSIARMFLLCNALQLTETEKKSICKLYNEARKEAYKNHGKYERKVKEG